MRAGTWLVLTLLPGRRTKQTTDESSNPDHKHETDADAALDKMSRHLFQARLRLYVFAPPDRQMDAERKLDERAAAFAPFVLPRRTVFARGRVRRVSKLRKSLDAPSWLASSEELASLWHPATQTVGAVNMESAAYRQLEPPANIPRKEEEGTAVLGRSNTLHHRVEFGLRLDDRRRHLAVIGKTGMGKSTLLGSLITADIESGRGVVLIDPHGDLAEHVVAAVPRPRTADIVYFDAGDRDYPIAFNPLSHRDSVQRALVAAGIVSAFRKLFSDSWGPRLEHILRNALLALLESPDTTLISLHRMLFDASYCKGIVSQVGDPAVAAFWRTEWKSWRDNYRNEAIAPVLNKVGHFLSNPVLRSIFGQPRSRLDLRKLIDNEQVLIANLSKGRIGEDASNLLGSLLVSSLQLAAMSRADVPEDQRNDCFMYVDEFQNFATESFATILSEARKYRLNLTIANQYLEQVDDDVLAAVFGNVGSLLAFQVGTRDAEEIAQQFGGHVTPRDMIQLPKYHAYARLMVDGASSKPFSLTTLPSKPLKQDRSEFVRRQSRQRYARPAEVVQNEVKNQFSMAH